MDYIFKYYPSPGITYDIVKMLFVKLSAPNIWHEALTTIDSQDESIKFIQEHSQLLPDPKPELSLFVYIPSNKTTTFLSMITAHLISENFCSFSISDLILYFSNVEKVQNDLYAYYLGEQDYSDPNIDLDYVIRHNKNISDKIKIMLLGFSLSPIKYISYLIKTLTSYYDFIQNKWAQHPDISLDLTTFTNILLQKSYNNLVISSDTSISYSLSFTTPLFLYHNLKSDLPFFITTFNTIIKIQNEQNQSLPTNQLIQLAHAISDKNRVSIIRLLITHSKLTIHEIAETLNISLTATKYHVDLLKKAKLINTTRDNRKVLYSYNPTGFKNIIKSLEKIEKGV